MSYMGHGTRHINQPCSDILRFTERSFSLQYSQLSSSYRGHLSQGEVKLVRVICGEFGLSDSKGLKIGGQIQGK